MEFKVNKIDTDIRRKIQSETKENKVHFSKGINIKKDIKDEQEGQANNSNKEKHEKKHITIDGVKFNNKNIDIDAEKIEQISEGNSKGRILDTTK